MELIKITVFFTYQQKFTIQGSLFSEMNGNQHSRVKDIDEMTSSDGDIRSGKSSPDDSDALNLTSTTHPTSTILPTARTSSSPPLLMPFHSSDPCPSGSPTTAAMASVQAALAALQAGQMSLNQVTIVMLFRLQHIA